mgnify:CR=1 FL=1
MHTGCPLLKTIEIIIHKKLYFTVLNLKAGLQKITDI